MWETRKTITMITRPEREKDIYEFKRQHIDQNRNKQKGHK